MKDIFDPTAEVACDGKGKRQAGIVLAGLDGVDRLSRDADRLAKLTLGKSPRLAQFPHPVLHRYFRVPIAAPIIHSVPIKGQTHTQLRFGKPAF